MKRPKDKAPWPYSVDQVRNEIVDKFDPETAEALLVVRDKFKTEWVTGSCAEWVDSILVDVVLVITDEGIRDAFRRDA